MCYLVCVGSVIRFQTPQHGETAHTRILEAEAAAAAEDDDEEDGAEDEGEGEGEDGGGGGSGDVAPRGTPRDGRAHAHRLYLGPRLARLRSGQLAAR